MFSMFLFCIIFQKRVLKKNQCKKMSFEKEWQDEEKSLRI